MAITLKGSVGDLAAAFNPMWFYFDSDNKSKEGFRYIFDLHDGGTAVKTRYNPPPRPIDGYGQLDLAPIIRCRLGYDLNPGATTSLNALNSYYRYDLKIGEEYLAAFAYSGYSQLTGTGTQFDGKVRLTTTSAHPFVIGDQIELKQTDGGTAVPLLESLFTVVYVPNSTSVVIDLNFYLISTSPAMGGTIYYSDKRKIQVPAIFTLSNYTAYNGAIEIVDFNSFDYTLRKFTTATGAKKFLTSCPNNLPISLNADIQFNIATMGGSLPRKLRITTSDGDIFDKALTGISAAYINSIPVGSKNITAMTGLTVISGALPVIKPTTTSYSVRVLDAANNQISELRSFILDRRCDPKDIQLSFVDKQGSLISYSFPLQAIFENDFEKETYETNNGGLNAVNLKYEYEANKGGKTVINSERIEGMTLTTNWLEWEQANFLNELLSSPIVLLRNNGIYKAAEVVTLSQPIQHPNKKKLINRVVQVKLSNQNPINV